MRLLTQFMLNKVYERLEKLGDKLIEANGVIDWEKFRHIVVDMYDNRSKKGSRPNFDEILMVKLWFFRHGMAVRS